jgi:hypothetical protein
MRLFLVLVFVLCLPPGPLFSLGTAEQETVREEEPVSRKRSSERGSDGLLKNPGTPPVTFYKDYSADFGRSTVYFDAIISGGPPKDGIPSIDHPVFTDTEGASEWIRDLEPVLLLRLNGRIRVYPLQILMWHEIVNDTVGETPVTVTYSPLSRLTFGTTGLLRYSNLIMYDRESGSWWQQATGEGIVGEHAGRKLELLPAAVLPWQLVEEQYADAEVLSRESGNAGWPYGSNPYEGYDTSLRPFLYRGPELEERLSPMERVLAVQIEDEEKAFTYSQLRREKVHTDTLAGEEIVLFWQPGTASPLDSTLLASGRDVGSAQAFYPTAAGRRLAFYHDGEHIRDRETGSIWTISGKSVQGELEGSQLSSPLTINHFWFSWHAFRGDLR